MSEQPDDTIGTEAARWFAIMRGPDAGARRAEFERWQRSDPRRARAYVEVDGLFDVARNASPAHARLDRRHTGPRRLLPFSIAAAVVAAIALGTFAGPLFKPSGQQPPAQVVARDASIERLGDGTLVWLGAATLVTADLSDAVRAIRLTSGQARFVVRRDAARVFAVTARDVVVRTYGGTFDITVEDSRVRLTAIYGDVTIAARGTETPVAAGATAAVAADGTVAPHTAADATWPPTRLEADGLALGDVAALANAVAGPRLVAGTPDIAELRVSGTFDIRDVRSLARKLAAALDLRIEYRDGEIVLLPR